MGELSVTFEAADRIAAVAPSQGIVAGTPILTLDGEMPVQFLSPGDRIITRNGARVLAAVEVTLLQGAEMVRIHASALGHDRPEADLFVAPDQPILVRDWRARALYGRDMALVPAQRLADGDYVRKERVTEARVFTLRFEREEVIYAGGLELGCAPATVAA